MGNALPCHHAFGCHRCVQSGSRACYRYEYFRFAALGYSLISPIINGLACATFFAFYKLYKYLFLWVYEEDPTNDTGGLFYPKALQHVFVGLYINEVSGPDLGSDQNLTVLVCRCVCLLCSYWRVIPMPRDKWPSPRPSACSLSLPLLYVFCQRLVI